MDSFIYEIEYREVLQYPHTYAMPRAPGGVGFKCCKGYTCLVLQVEPKRLVTE